MKRSNSLIADVPPPSPLEPNRPDRLHAKSDEKSDKNPDNKTADTTDKSSDQAPGRLTEHEAAPSAANLAGFCGRRQHPHCKHATVSVAPFYVETEAA
jgi:hypothetical protein